MWWNRGVLVLLFETRGSHTDTAIYFISVAYKWLRYGHKSVGIVDHRHKYAQKYSQKITRTDYCARIRWKNLKIFFKKCFVSSLRFIQIGWIDQISNSLPLLGFEFTDRTLEDDVHFQGWTSISQGCIILGEKILLFQHCWFFLFLSFISSKIW